MHVYVNNRKVRLGSGIISHDLLKGFAAAPEERFNVRYKKMGQEEETLHIGQTIAAEAGMDIKIHESATAEEHNPFD